MKVNKIWHDASEKPIYNKDSKNHNQIVVYGGDEWKYSLSVCSMIDKNTIYAPILKREYEWSKYPFTKWAYIDDLLNLQEEPVSKELKEAAEKYAYNECPSIGVQNIEYERAFTAGWLAKEQQNSVSVSEDLEEAAKNHAVERFRTTRNKELAEKCKWSFIAGSQWKERQVMKGLCFETGVYRDSYGDGIETPYSEWFALGNNEIGVLPDIGLEDGDRVKVIIIKDE